jgi:hypothetical protein
LFYCWKADWGLKYSHKMQKLLNNHLLIHSLWFYAWLKVIKANKAVWGMARQRAHGDATSFLVERTGQWVPLDSIFQKIPVLTFLFKNVILKTTLKVHSKYLWQFWIPTFTSVQISLVLRVRTRSVSFDSTYAQPTVDQAQMTYYLKRCAGSLLCTHGNACMATRLKPRV